MDHQERTNLYLLGRGVGHSIAPPMHNYIASALSLPWKFSNLECPTVEDMVKVINDTTTAGAVITMPYKQSVMPHLDDLDQAAQDVGAVNNVFLSFGNEHERPKLHGSNTDYLGIVGCLKSASSLVSKSGTARALIIGAGGAARAAVYALITVFDIPTIYIVNRDVAEVEALQSDVAKYTASNNNIEIIHIRSSTEAGSLAPPSYVVGTVPDFEPSTTSELEARAILEALLKKEPGVLLDMCFKPRNTRTMQLARGLGWECIEGTKVIGYQIEKQWELWTGKVLSESVKIEAWKILDEAAEKSTAINF